MSKWCLSLHGDVLGHRDKFFDNGKEAKKAFDEVVSTTNDGVSLSLFARTRITRKGNITTEYTFDHWYLPSDNDDANIFDNYGNPEPD